MDFFLFAVEPETAFNVLDFKNNLINWILLMAGVVWLWNKYTPSMFESRKQSIQGALQDAATAKEQSEQLLKDQQTRVANQDQEAAKILDDARKLAAELKVQLDEQTAKDVADLRQKLENRIANERQMMISEMRSAAAQASIKLTREVLPSLMSESVKTNLLNQFMEQLDSATSQRSTISSDMFDAKSVR